VAFVVASVELNFAKEMADGFRSGVASVAEVEQTVVGPDFVDGPREVQLFSDVTQSHADGVSVFTLSPELFTDRLARAARAGIPLIAVDNPPPHGSQVELFVGNDNYTLGQMLADQAIARLPADARGVVVLGVNAPGVPVLERRASAMRDRFREKLPEVTVLGPFDTKQEVAANHAAWTTLVGANPDALAFLGTGDADGWNLADIRKNTGGTWLAGAFDLDPKSLLAVQEGSLLLVSPEHFVKGAVAGRLQAAHAKDAMPLPKGWIYTPGLAVTPENVDEILRRQASIETKQAWFAPQVSQILAGGPDYLRPLDEVS
jgi:ribose transport system substrate-binding protein